MTPPQTKTPIPPPPSRPAPPVNGARPAPNGSAPPAIIGKAAVLDKRPAVFQPPRIVLNAVEGWGKTSAAAHADRPVILMASGETGYDTLLGAGLVPSVDAAVVSSWPELLATLDAIIAEPGKYGTVVFDALAGFDLQCQAHVCHTEFNDDWSEHGFGSFQKGYERTAMAWPQALVRLDKIRDTSKATILLLSHVKLEGVRNPVAPDYDVHSSDSQKRSWPVIAKWSDAVLFGEFETFVKGGAMEEEKIRAKKGKSYGGTERILHTERSAGWIAKNRYGMPPILEIPKDYTQVWATIWAAITANKAG